MKLKLIMLSATAIALALASLIASSCCRSDKQTDAAQRQHAPSAQGENPIETIDSLNELLSIIEGYPGKLLVFDLYADWCKPCKMLAPILAKLASDHSKHAGFFSVDIDRNPEVGSVFRVRSIPLVVFMKDKEVVHSVSGLRPRESYERVITACGPSVSAEECRTKLEDRL